MVKTKKADFLVNGQMQKQVNLWVKLEIVFIASINQKINETEFTLWVIQINFFLILDFLDQNVVEISALLNYEYLRSHSITKLKVKLL